METIKNNFYCTFNYPTDKEIKQLVESDNLTYLDESDRANFEELCMWRKRNSKAFILLKKNRKVIGYIILLPLTENCYQKYRNGEILEEEIKENEIIPWRKNPNVLFNNVSIIPEFQNTEAIEVLTNALIKKLEELSEKGIILKTVVAEVDSKDGEKYLVNRFGFQPVNTKNKRHYLYELPPNIDLLSAFKTQKK